MNPELKPAVDFITSIKPTTMRQKVAQERALEALGLHTLSDDELAKDEAAQDEYRKFKNLEEVIAAIDSGLMSAETALILEKATKERVTYIDYLEDRIAEEGDDA